MIASLKKLFKKDEEAIPKINPLIMGKTLYRTLSPQILNKILKVEGVYIYENKIFYKTEVIISNEMLRKVLNM